MIKDQAKEIGQNGFMIYPRDNLDEPVRIELGGGEDEDGEDSAGNPITKNKKKANAMKNRRRKKDDHDTENIYAEDPGRLDMIGNLTSTRLLEISERFDMFPSG